MKVSTLGRWRPHRPPADGGFPHRVNVVVRERAGRGDADLAKCEACGRLLGRYGGQVQPRLVSRDQDGGVDPVAGGAANAVLLCGTSFELCLGACVSGDRDMESRGFWISDRNGPGDDPRRVPLVIPGPPGLGLIVWLTDAGTYDCAPPARRT
jgi:hypothetical protein